MILFQKIETLFHSIIHVTNTNDCVTLENTRDNSHAPKKVRRDDTRVNCID